MSQLSFLDSPQVNSHIARESDPATSQESARETLGKLNVLQARFVRVISELGPATAAEAGQLCASMFGGMAESYRKRAGECRRRGVVEIIGTRKCSVSGKPASIYQVHGGSDG